MNRYSWLRDIKAVLLDVDGVLYRGTSIIPDAHAFLEFLASHHIRFLYVTNNSTMDAAGYAERLRRRGFPATAEHVIGSAETTAHLLARKYPHRPPVLVIGEEGLHQALKKQHFPITDVADRAEIVVSGMDRSLTYDRLAEATYALRRGAAFYATNPDRTYPTERGLAPGAGAIIAALEAASDRTATVVGKPEPPIFQLALERARVAPANALMIGDRLETDILGGKRVGMHTALVLTGVTQEPPPPGPNMPDIVVQNLTELQRWWEAALTAVENEQ